MTISDKHVNLSTSNSKLKAKMDTNTNTNVNVNEVVEDIDEELEPYPGEDAMEYEQRLKQLIKRRKETGYYKMKTLIKTDNSALNIYELEPEIVALLEQSVQEVDPELDYHPEIKIFDKICHQQRSIGFYSDTSKGYNYSNSLTPSKQMKPCLRELLIYVNDKFDASFNGILINKYENGEEYIGKHSDDEKGLQPNCGVISMSFGAVRKFRIRDKNTGKIVLDVPTEPNKIIQMAGNFQKEFTHEIPVEKKVKECRYSLTFRRHLI